MKKAYHYILICALGLMFVTCMKMEDEGNVQDDPAEDYITFSLGTKSGSSSSTTYRALLHDQTPDVADTIPYPYLNLSGTYRGPETDERPWLTACTVDPVTGAWISDGHTGGLRARRSTYRISFVSPAKAPSPFDTISLPQRIFQWGYHLRRDDPEDFYISSPVKMELKGNHIGGKDVYDVSDTTILRERRAKVRIVLKCGNDLHSVSVSRIGWSNLYSEAWFNIGRDTLERLKPSGDTVICFNPASPIVLTHDPGQESAVAVEGFRLFALDYTREIPGQGKAYPSTPKLHLTVGPKTLTIDAMHECRPQYEYTYTITINTAFISVDVTASPWTDELTQSGSVSDYDTFVTSFTWTCPDGWLNGGTADGTIDS